MVDLTLALATAIITASVVIMGAFLARYRQLVKEAKSSSRLAKDIWDSANSRFSVLDARIIDVMAKTEVLSSRFSSTPTTLPPTSHPPSRLTSQSPPPSAPSQPAEGPTPLVTTQARQVAARPAAVSRTETKTEAQVLGLLAKGPLSSAEIKTALDMSREHVARLMKGLFDRGLVVRNDRNKPYVYEITDAGRSHVAV